MMANAPLNVIDLFAGCGGLSLGLENAGFRPAFVCELNRSALETYVWNRHDSSGLGHLALTEGKEGTAIFDGFTAHDINEVLKPEYLRRLSAKLESSLDIELKGVDLVAGGPPCQGYSRIGHRRSYSVDKAHLPSNHLYERMITFIEKSRPKMFLFENVYGLLSARWTATGEPREVWRDVLRTFASLSDYWVAPAAVHAADYGVPQRRPRVFIVGLKRGVNPNLDEDLARRSAEINGAIEGLRHSDYPNLLPNAVAAHLFPASCADATWPTPLDLLSDLMEPLSTVRKVAGQTRRLIGYSDKPRSKHPYVARLRIHRSGKPVVTFSNHDYSKHSAETIERFHQLRLQSQGKFAQVRPTKKFAQRILPQAWNGKPNITITSLPDDYIHFKQDRSLTVRESARFQGFPDWYEFRGPRTTGGIRRAGNPREGVHDREVPQYTQVGNAVPVALAERIGQHFREIITGKRFAPHSVGSSC